MRITLKVADVLDGRTFLTNNQQTVILQGVVVPGLLSPIGRRAKTRLEELILHKHVDCDDVTDDEERNLVAQVWIDGQNVNDIIGRIVKGNEVGLRSDQFDEPGNTTAKPPAGKIEITIDESAFGVKPRSPTPGLKYSRRQ